MPRKQAGRTTGREVGKRQTRATKGMTARQQIWLAGLVAYCTARETAVFIGTPTTTGSVRLNLYPPDDRCQGSLHLLDNWEQEVPAMLSDVFEEEITADDIVRAVPWLVGAAAGAPLDEKPKLRPSEVVEVPQKPAR